MELSNIIQSSRQIHVGDCIHCGNPLQSDRSVQFCCLGCETVYHWIQNQQLGDFYQLKSKTRSIRKATPPLSNPHNLLQNFDDPEFLNRFSWQTPEGRWMQFYLKGVHCAACVWLTEKIATTVSHVSFARLNLSNSVMLVRIDALGTFAPVALELQNMGYQPYPVQPNTQNFYQAHENRLYLIRLGVAGACAGNLMLLAISLYGGASGPMASHFRWISFGLYLPVFFFSAVPFYQSAWNALRAKILSIDIPVVFGLLLGSAVSTINLFMYDERIYFDSLSSLIFLLLCTRYLLKRTQQITLQSSYLQYSIIPNYIKKWNTVDQIYEQTTIDQIHSNDLIQILPGDCIPIDGIILKGTSTLNCSLLTGESAPEKVKPGHLVFAGTMNLDSPLDIQVTQSGSKTRVGRILAAMEHLLTQKAPITLFADSVAHYFVATVLILFGLTLLWGLQGNWHDGLNRALAVVIVTCPCTFALITPLAFSMTLSKLARAGILVKSPNVLEKLTRIKSVFLDKTGTLTFGTPQIIQWNVPSELSSTLLAIESYSIHPIAKALVQYLQAHVIHPLPQAEEVQETIGFGIRARIDQDWFELSRSTENTALNTTLLIYKNGMVVGSIVLSDPIRPDAKSAIAQLRSLRLNPWILSGDHQTSVAKVAHAVGIDLKQCISAASPEKKKAVIQNNPHSLMVGDGANDAIALAQADVGIAVHQGVEISLRAADVYLNRPGVQSIATLIQIARETLSIVRRNLAFSVFYNLIAGGFALAGKIDPLLAAILMPLSAFTVFLSSLAGTATLRKAMKELNL